MMESKLFLLGVLLVLLSPVYASPVTNLTIINDFPDFMYGGESFIFNCSFNSEEVPVVFSFKLESPYILEFENDLPELKDFYLKLDNTSLQMGYTFPYENMSFEEYICFNGKYLIIYCPYNLTQGNHTFEIYLQLAPHIQPGDYNFEFNILPEAKYQQMITNNYLSQNIEITKITSERNHTYNITTQGGKNIEIDLKENELYTFGSIDDIDIIPAKSGLIIDCQKTQYTKVTKELRITANGTGNHKLYIYSPYGEPNKVYFDDNSIPFVWDENNGITAITGTFGSFHTFVFDWNEPETEIIYRGGSGGGTRTKYIENKTNQTFYEDKTIYVPYYINQTKEIQVEEIINNTIFVENTTRIVGLENKIDRLSSILRLIGAFLLLLLYVSIVIWYYHFRKKGKKEERVISKSEDENNNQL